MMAKKVNNILTKRQNTTPILKPVVPRFQYDFEVLGMIELKLTDIFISLYPYDTKLTSFEWNRGTVNIWWGLDGDKWFMQKHGCCKGSNTKNTVEEAKPVNEEYKSLFEIDIGLGKGYDHSNS